MPIITIQVDHEQTLTNRLVIRLAGVDVHSQADFILYHERQITGAAFPPTRIEIERLTVDLSMSRSVTVAGRELQVTNQVARMHDPANHSPGWCQFFFTLSACDSIP